MIYCQLINDYVDQNEKCIKCQYYLKLEDACNHPNEMMKKENNE